ncbi:AraC family transcriptional regulator [Paenibacillus alvei TS-15]|uniref:AraC family transcriptional regulator n=1 Tax=Paenibacillus alvei TS-15 TaxID=1117108 RepID=S9STV0_PAEAL|nr:response regulator [Paenibacillus alvei]EPY09182.1 AraC family transcriptional regulator [Paenibacillus alvei TS-15]
MRILVADDEALVRASLRSMLDELNMPVHVIGEARNGEEALRYVAERQPDLVFVDIRMPKLNGLEVIAQSRDNSPHTKWIIVSGHSEFQYAKEALRLGACNYLLKPFGLDELQDSLIRAQEIHDAHILDLNRKLEHAILSCMQGSSDNQASLCELEARRRRYKVSAFFFDGSLSEQETLLQQRQFHEQLQWLIRNQSLTTSLHTVALPLTSGNPAIAWSWPVAHQQHAMELQQEMEDAVQQMLIDELSSSPTITTIQIEECANLQEAAQKVEELQRIAPLRMLFPMEHTLALHDLLELDQQHEWLSISHLGERVCRLFRQQDYHGYSKAIVCMEKELRRLRGTHLADRDLVHRIQESISYSIGISIDKIEDQECWFEQLKSLGDQMIIQPPRHDSMNKDIVQQVVAFVDEHYMHNIGMKQIADMFHVTPNYLSSLFHKKHGIPFLKYVTETRMLKAKELLLKEPHLKVQEVAEAVGYYSARHFAKLFRDYYECYPSELKEQGK